MSRIGKAPVELPKGVEASVNEQAITIKGKLGSVRVQLVAGVTAAVTDGKLVVSRANEEKQTRAQHGTTRALAQNAVEGVTEGFKKSLEVVGVGYRAVLQGKKLAMNVGFANTIYVDIPDGVKVELPDQTHINVSGIDKHLVGQVAANIRAARKPEPYKGKGVRYANEVVRRKAGKSAAGGKK